MSLGILDLTSMPNLTTTLLFVLAISIWKLSWYGIALYKTLKKNQQAWFAVLFVAAFVLNDLGILAIIYLLLNKNNPIKKKSSKKKK